MQALFDWATCVRRGRQSDSGCRSWGSWQKWRKSDGTSAVLPCMHCYSVLRSAGTHITTRTFSPQLRCSEICRWYTSAILHLYLFLFFFNFFWQTILFVLESDFGLMFSIPPPVAAPGEAELNVKDEQRVWRAVGVTSISRGAGREDYTSVLLQNNFYVQQRPMCWRLKLKTVMFFYHLQFLFCVLDFCKQKRQE